MSRSTWRIALFALMQLPVPIVLFPLSQNDARLGTPWGAPGQHTPELVIANALIGVLEKMYVRGNIGPDSHTLFYFDHEPGTATAILASRYEAQRAEPTQIHFLHIELRSLDSDWSALEFSIEIGLTKFARFGLTRDRSRVAFLIVSAFMDLVAQAGKLEYVPSDFVDQGHETDPKNQANRCRRSEYTKYLQFDFNTGRTKPKSKGCLIP